MVSYRSMTLIEFTGVPGSGKTHLCRILSDRLRSREIPVLTPLEGVAETNAVRRMGAKFVTLSLFALTHVPLAVRSYYTIARTRQSSVLDAVRSFATLLNVVRVVEKGRRVGDIVLLDQGVVQSAFTILYAAGKVPNADAFNGLPVPDMLIEVDADGGAIADRLRSRPGRQSRMEGEGERGLAKARLAMARVRETELYAAIPDRRLIRNDGGADPVESIGDLAESIARKHHEKKR